MPDPIYGHPRLAAVYDTLDPDRSDLDAYVDLVDEVGARSVLDVGCGTGTFAVRLAGLRLDVTGVDPAAASLAVARGRPGAGRVRWIEGDATTLPADLRVDLAVMTGNAVQAVVADEDWAATLAGVHAALRPRGVFAFETRRPDARAWEGWTEEATRTLTATEAGDVDWWYQILDVAEPLVTFRGTYRFLADGTELTSDSTLRFRTQAEVEASLATAGFAVDDVRDAPDRPGLEMVFVARAS